MIPIVVIAASAGDMKPLRQIIQALPSPSPAAIFVVMQIGQYSSQLPAILTGGLAVSFAEDGAPIEPGHIYVAPSDRHMFVEVDSIKLTRDPKFNYTRPSADPLFFSAARSHGKHVLGVVLGGRAGDGAEGLRFIKEHGGIALVQDPEEAEMPAMSESAIQADRPDAVLYVSRIARLVSAFCAMPSLQEVLPPLTNTTVAFRQEF